jgi:hypothetical protein
MIEFEKPSSDKKPNTLKEIREREKQAESEKLKQACNSFAYEKFGEKEVMALSNKHKGLWYLPILDDEGNIEKMAIMKPIDRHILSYASTKVQEEGLYIFLEACMRECFLLGDMEIIEDDDYFLPAANKFNGMIEGKKAALLKR